MNKETLTGSCDSKGLFKAKNPYLPTSGNIIQVNEYNQFGLDHPELFCYTPSNELVIDVENVEVIGPVWQWDYKPPAMTYGWRNASPANYTQYTFERFANANHALQTRKVYLTVPTTEHKDPIQYTTEEYLDLHGSPDGVYPEKIKSDMTGMYKGTRVFDKKDNLLKNWTGYASKAKCMYDDNHGYQEWNVTDTPDRDKANGYRVRDCWVAVSEPDIATTEAISEKADAQPVKEVEKIKQAAELFSAKGLHEFHSPAYQGFIAGVKWREGNPSPPTSKEVKSAEEIKSHWHALHLGEDYTEMEYRLISNVVDFTSHAQFATEAGGGKEPPLWYDEISLTNHLQNKHYHKDIISELVKGYAENLQQAFKKGWEKGYNDIQNNGTWDYVYYRPENTSAPSNNSSSEMVERDDFDDYDCLPGGHPAI